MLRLEQWEHIQELARQGLSVSAIERETGFNWKTIKRYVGGPPWSPGRARHLQATPVPSSRSAPPRSTSSNACAASRSSRDAAYSRILVPSPPK